MSKYIKLALALSVLVITALIFIYPHILIAPGDLTAAHAKLNQDCFACHTPFKGVQANNCTTCHKPTDIGIKTTQGLPILTAHTTIAFHQKLKNQNCMSCHSDHMGVSRYKNPSMFNHSLLADSDLQQCQSCHNAPNDTLHSQMGLLTGNKESAAFSRPPAQNTTDVMINQLNAVIAEASTSPKTSPKTTVNKLHAQTSNLSCNQCHTPTQWKPTTFNHNQYFVLDQNHNTTCSTCHAQNTFKQFTCYGCHEHNKDKVRLEHSEEGITNIDNCVSCHRSAHDTEEGDED